MQTPGRRVEPQTSMLPLERRMDGLERRIISLSSQVEFESRNDSIRGLGRIVLEMEQMQNNMEAMQREIRRDLRERAKYFKEEQKLLKKDLKNTEDFKTAALFDLRKIIGLFGFAVAANELSQGDIGGAIQGVGLGIGAFLPEITTGVVSILAAKGLIGGGMMGGSMMGGGMAAGGLGMLGGKGKGLLALAALGTVLLASGALAGGGSKTTRQLDSGFDGNDVINRSDTLRFRSQLGRFGGIMDDVEKTSATPPAPDEGITDAGMDMMGSMENAPDNTKTESPTTETSTTVDPSQPISSQVVQQQPQKEQSLSQEDIDEFDFGSGNIMPAVMSPISEEELIEARSTIIPASDRITENNISENFIENLSWSPAPKQPVMKMDTDSRDFNILAAISALESSSKQGQADVAQSIYNRLQDKGQPYGSTIHEVITRDYGGKIAQYQPAYTDPKGDEKQFTAPIWKAITDQDSAIDAMMYYYEMSDKAKTRDQVLLEFQNASLAIQNSELQMEAAKHVGGRTEFLAGKVKGDDVVDRGDGTSFDQHNAFFSEYGSRTQLERGAQPIPEDLLIKQVEVEKAPNQWWDFMDVFPNKQASVTTLPRDREGTSNLIAQPIIATIPGKVTTMPPPSTGEEEFGGDRFAEINTRFQGSIDKLDSAYALNSYAALS